MSQNSSENVLFIFDFIEELCGISLDQNKSYLIDARLAPLVKQFNVRSATELVEKAKSAGGDTIRKALVEAMTTRETYFFRDTNIFDALKFKAIPELIDEKLKSKTNRLRIWSAAASTGQEACSIAMILSEMIPDLPKWNIEIIGTDISEDALAKARKGAYTKLDVDRGMPPEYIRKYMRPTADGYQVHDSLLRMVRYQQINLLNPFPFREQFDIIFCRNVAIYFEKKVKIDLFRRMLPLLPAYGYLFVGGSETLFDCGPEFKAQSHCKGTFYQPNRSCYAISVGQIQDASSVNVNAGIIGKPASPSPLSTARSTAPATALGIGGLKRTPPLTPVQTKPQTLRKP
ncbi:MAG: protein-glutamate O-methyltransferase CheR [Pirellula sp.]|jgi:chemotaxis protein methyltransferase CheR|nr:protein-glutamate O-methyltransferase CheR [Pirellula sp.]